MILTLLALALALDPLEEIGTPTDAEIAASVQDIRPVVGDLAVPGPVELLRDPTTLDVDTAFRSGTAELRPGVAERLAALDLGPVTVVGHTDEDEDPELGMRRAEAVAAVLPGATAENRAAAEPATYPPGSGDEERAALDRRIRFVPR